MKDKMYLHIRSHFDAAHYLPMHKGKCALPHGHTWEVLLSIRVKRPSGSGIAIDFQDLNCILNEILSVYDHQSLNLLISNPTCENLAMIIAVRVHKRLQKEYWNIYMRELSVTITEGAGGKVSYLIKEEQDAYSKVETEKDAENTTKREGDFRTTGIRPEESTPKRDPRKGSKIAL